MHAVTPTLVADPVTKIGDGRRGFGDGRGRWPICVLLRRRPLAVGYDSSLLVIRAHVLSTLCTHFTSPIAGV